MARIRHPQKYGKAPIYRGSVTDTRPQYDPAKLPAGYVPCPQCNIPARTLQDGVTVRGHNYQGGKCPGSNQRVEAPVNGIYRPAKVYTSAVAVPCPLPSCNAEVGQYCTSPKGTIYTASHAARRAIYHAQGEVAVLVEGEGVNPAEVIDHRLGRRPRPDYRSVPCPDCKVDVGEKCIINSTHLSRKRMAVRKFNHEVHGIEY